MTPKQQILQWVERFNQGDVEALANMYAQDAVIHQTPIGFIEGRENIRKMFQDEFNQYDMVCLVDGLFVEYDVCVLEWKDPKGLRGCSIFRFDQGLIRFQRGYWDMLSFSNQQDISTNQQPI
jgi:hypothetical protein